MLATAPISVTPEEIYIQLMASRRAIPIQETLARMLSSWSLGIGALPNYLGLSKDDFEHMMALYFPGYDLNNFKLSGKPFDVARFDEAEDLRKLLLENRTNQSLVEQWMADIVIAGCMGSNHLWQDLGLWNRNELSCLMLENFKPLAKRNNKDMKWKKFLYKQLCESEGIYVCRSPSCEVCTDYQNCFGPED